jgi:hypothetical protein
MERPIVYSEWDEGDWEALFEAAGKLDDEE